MRNIKKHQGALARTSFAAMLLAAALLIGMPAASYSATICTGPCCGTDCDDDESPTPVTINTKEIFDLLYSLYNDILVKKIKPAIDQTTAAVIGSSAGAVKGIARLVQALIDYEYKIAVAEQDAQIAGNKARTTLGENLLCNIISANQLEHISKIYADVVSDYLSRNAYDFSFGAAKKDSSGNATDGSPKCRGPKAGHGDDAYCDEGNGIYEAVTAQCFLGTWDPEDYSEDKPVYGFCGKDGSSVSSVGMKHNTLNDDMKKADRRMDTIFGELQFVSATTTASNNPAQKKSTDVKNVRKRQFLAALNFCYNIYGFPPSRSVGVVAKSDEHIAEVAQFDAWEAQNFPVLQRCLQIVAEHARPDCDDNNMKLFCAAQNQGCKNAKLHGIDVSQFDDCEYGLSYAEARQIAQEGCLSSYEYVNLGSTTTATQADIIEHARLCGQRVEAYQANLKQEQDDFVALILKRNIKVGK